MEIGQNFLVRLEKYISTIAKLKKLNGISQMNGIGWYCKSKSHVTKIYENSHLLLLLFKINLREKNAKNHYQSKDNYRNNNNNQGWSGQSTHRPVTNTKTGH